MGNAFLYGTGGANPLNFDLVAAPQQPAARENRIWVETGTPYSDYVASIETPGAQAGRLWLALGISSRAPINLLKKNDIELYVAAVKQHIDGAWVSKSAKICVGGTWTALNGYLFANGEDHIPNLAQLGGNGSFSKNLAVNGIWMNAYQTTLSLQDSVNAFNTAGFDALSFAVWGTDTTENINTITVGLSQTPNAVGSLVVSAAARNFVAKRVYTMDVSALNGAFYLQIRYDQPWGGWQGVYVGDIQLI